jgi:predicted RNase H-like nuclease (RuvC/YqgF family)
MGCPKVFTPTVGGGSGECDHFIDARCVTFSANCNGDVEKLENVILSLREENKRLQTCNSKLTTKVSNAESTVMSLRDKVRAFEDRLKELEIKIELQ